MVAKVLHHKTVGRVTSATFQRQVNEAEIGLPAVPVEAAQEPMERHWLDRRDSAAWLLAGDLIHHTSRPLIRIADG